VDFTLNGPFAYVRMRISQPRDNRVLRINKVALFGGSRMRSAYSMNLDHLSRSPKIGRPHSSWFRLVLNSRQTLKQRSRLYCIHFGRSKEDSSSLVLHTLEKL
jgi:hypothetical protein